MKLALLVKYLGTSFEGFQAQPSGNTIQQHLTSAISALLGLECNITGCSRTDSGVHANGFVALVSPADPSLLDQPWCSIPAGKFHRAVRQHLHKDIAVIGAAYVDDSFHPRYDVDYKEYTYFMKDTPDYDPFLNDRVWQLRSPVDDDKLLLMQNACKEFVGSHDFAAFMSKGSSVTETVRNVKYAFAERENGLIKFTVAADGFLYNMVRIMAGTLVGIAYGEDIDIPEAIATGNRSLLGITAPPEGLYLNRVSYSPEIFFLCD